MSSHLEWRAPCGQPSSRASGTGQGAAQVAFAGRSEDRRGTRRPYRFTCASRVAGTRPRRPCRPLVTRKASRGRWGRVDPEAYQALARRHRAGHPPRQTDLARVARCRGPSRLRAWLYDRPRHPLPPARAGARRPGRVRGDRPGARPGRGAGDAEPARGVRDPRPPPHPTSPSRCTPSRSATRARCASWSPGDRPPRPGSCWPASPPARPSPRSVSDCSGPRGEAGPSLAEGRRLRLAAGAVGPPAGWRVSSAARERAGG